MNSGDNPLWNLETRTHVRVVRCVDCTYQSRVFEGEPIAAHRTAGRHAKHHDGHHATVMDITALKVEYTYHRDIKDPLADDEFPF